MYKSFLKSGFCIAFIFLVANAATAQIDTSIKIDLLRAPSSPASSMLGMASSDIEKPSDANAFMTSLRNATNNFTTLPKSFALDFAPFKIFGKKILDAKTLTDKKHTFRHTTIISLGINSVEKDADVVESVDKTQFGAGLKFSLIRGDINDESKKAFTEIYRLQKEDQDKTIRAQRTPEFMKLNEEQKDLFEKKRTKVREGAPQTEIDLIDLEMEINKNKQTDFISKLEIINREEIRQEAAKIKLERVGFNLDFSAGTVVDFLDNKIDNSYITKAGAWLTGGNTNSSGSFSFLGIVRYLYNPKTPFADPNLNQEKLHTLDGGMRLIGTAMEKKLLISGEGIFRGILNKANATNSWRIVLNAEYEIGVNQRLTFSFGRNFDGQTYRGGNVISALNYIVGFGKQKISKSDTQ